MSQMRVMKKGFEGFFCIALQPAGSGFALYLQNNRVSQQVQWLLHKIYQPACIGSEVQHNLASVVVIWRIEYKKGTGKQERSFLMDSQQVFSVLQ